jgi:hypothetical protein
MRDVRLHFYSTDELYVDPSRPGREPQNSLLEAYLLVNH